MTKLYLQAMRKLPDHFVDDATDIMDCTKEHGFVVAINHKYPPLKFKDGEWGKIEIYVATDRKGF